MKGGEKLIDKAATGSIPYRRIEIDYRLLNGKPRATLIQRFDGSAILLGPNEKKFEFESGATLDQIQAKAEQMGWVVAIEHLHKEREGRTG